ncbi:MAG: hypothetical protein ABJZ69_21005, partial [Hyphomicrobiales bacterium]
GTKINPENMKGAFSTFAGGDILGAAFAKKPSVKKTSSNHTTPSPSPSPSPSSSSAGTADSTRMGQLNARSEKIKAIARAAAIGIAKSVALSLAVLGPGFVMLFIGMTILGMLWLFVGSFAMMAWSYRKPWRLGAIACLIPPAAAAICYALQLLLFGIAAPPLILIAGAGIAGLAVGFWRASTHQVKRDASGAIIAERTIGYLLVWAVAYGATQLLGFIAISELAIRAGLMTGAFTTAMLATVSIAVWRQFKQLKTAPVASILAILVGLSTSISPHEARADAATLELMKGLSGTSSNPAALAGAMPAGTQVLSRKFGVIQGSSEFSGAQLEMLIAKGISDNGMLSAGYLLLPSNSSVANFLRQAIGGKSTESVSCGTGAAYLSVADDGTTISIAAQAHGKALIVETTESYNLPKPDRYGESVLRRVALATCQMYAGTTRGGSNAGTSTSSSSAPAQSGSETSSSSGRSNSSTAVGSSPNQSGGSGSSPFSPLKSADTPSVFSPEAAAVASVIAMVLVAAGIGANAAQAVAAAVANSIQSGVQLTAEEMQQAIGNALRDLVGRGGVSADPESKAEPESSNAPPNVSFSDRFRPPSKPEEAPTVPEQSEPEKAQPEKAQEPRTDAPDIEAPVATEDERPNAQPEQEPVSEPETTSEDEPPNEREEDTTSEPPPRNSATENDTAQPQPKEEEASSHEPRGPYRDPSTAQPGVDNSSTGWWMNALTEFSGGVIDDSVDLITQGPGALWEAGKSALKTAGDALSNRENWEIGLDALSETGRDLNALTSGNLDRIAKVGRNLGEGADTALKVGEHLKNELEKDPSGAMVGAAKVVLGAENWQKAVDPNVPVTERFGRAVWGTIDTGGTLVGMGGATAKGAGKLAGLIRTADTTGDAAAALKTADKLGDAATAARAADASGDAAAALKAGDKAGDAATAARATDTAGEGAAAARIIDDAEDGAAAARAADSAQEGATSARATDASNNVDSTAAAADKTSASTREAGLRARATDDAKPTTLDELREELANQKRGHTERGEDFVPGKNTEIHGLPEPKRDPAGYAEHLPSGALMDRNLATAGSGWTGHQIDDMARFAKNEDAIPGARTTNLDSMRHIRDGTAAPKEMPIKSKTIGELDVYLGARPEDKGLVGFFEPKLPRNMDDIPQHLQKDVLARFQKRTDELADYGAHYAELEKSGQIVVRDGKVHKVIKDAGGNVLEHRPFAGDIDGVYFRDTKTGKLIPPGERYDRLKDAWMGGNKEANVPDYWQRSNAPGQHGVETNLVADIAAQHTPGTPEYDEALKKARELHAKLASNHPGEVVLEVDQFGNVRRGTRFAPDGTSLPDLAKDL